MELPCASRSFKLAPALIAGNAAILKPSPHTPLTALLLVELAEGILPPGVLTVLTGDDALGQWMVDHPGIAKISFTGSVATGRKVMAGAAAHLKRVTLELGGNDPAIVLPDADLDACVPALFWAPSAIPGNGAWASSGSTCTTTSIRNCSTGWPPTRAACPWATAWTRPSSSGRCRTPGSTPRCSTSWTIAPGRACASPIAARCPPANRATSRRSPWSTTRPTTAAWSWKRRSAPSCRSCATGISTTWRAAPTDTGYGLGASIWGRDTAIAQALADRLEAGTVWINEVYVHGVDFPFGGHKLSGLGVEHGAEGLAAYANLKIRMTAR